MSGAMQRARKRWDAGERLPGRRRTLLLAMGLASAAIIGRSIELQGVEGARWRDVAAGQQQARVSVPARRGAIYDRAGVPLALTRETFSVSVAPREVRDRIIAAARLAKVLGISPAAARRATDPARAWFVVPGRFSAEQRQALDAVRGLHWERRLERFYPQGDVGREVLGAFSADDRALGGMEQALDATLRGTDGYSVFRRDSHGVMEPGAGLPVQPPRDGDDVYLTVDFGLQQIADEALSQAIESTKAAGGDMLLADPRTGEILAAVSKRPGGGLAMGAFVEPYEPGSTLKPFFVASLLAGRHATLEDRVFGENGHWKMPNGREIADVEENGWMTMRDALRVSSNIGMAKLSARIPPTDQYRRLRDFGFGMATGVEYPVEASGRLPRLAQWSDFTPASVAMGYEVSVTPLQLIMGYGALANGGLLMEPHLLREVRGPDGTSLRAVPPRPIRRVVPREVSDSLRAVLVSVVDSGTGKKASLATFDVAGKTGTARRTGAGGRYEAGSYNATFVGFFPAQSPQLAIYVKLDRPQGEYYGGATAAPVSRETFQAILAAHTRALDGRSLLATRMRQPTAGMTPAARTVDDGEAPAGGEGTYVLSVDSAEASASADRVGPADSRHPPKRAVSPPSTVSVEASGPAQVPALAGLPFRDAAHRLHALGFHVRLQGSGVVSATVPAAGASLARGATVVIVGGDR
ncbi:MAG: penicillin-binding protein transpeptidase [Gemmatimonadetes bacterium]|nr:penicillin-binding protein transpeptidase [Gemmatimonadota bacterium]